MSLFSQNKEGGLASPSKPAARRLLLFHLARMDEAIVQGLGQERSTINPVSSAPRGRTPQRVHAPGLISDGSTCCSVAVLRHPPRVLFFLLKLQEKKKKKKSLVPFPHVPPLCLGSCSNTCIFHLLGVFGGDHPRNAGGGELGKGKGPPLLSFPFLLCRKRLGHVQWGENLGADLGGRRVSGCGVAAPGLQKGSTVKSGGWRGGKRRGEEARGAGRLQERPVQNGSVHPPGK